MNTAIRYFSKTGHMKQMAEAVASVAGVEAKTVAEPLSEPVDTLFLGSGVYYAGVDAQVKDFIAKLDPKMVKNVVCFSSAALIPSSYAQVKGLLEKRGIKVDEREFHCKGQFSLLHRGRPNADDLSDLKAFVKAIVK